MARVSLTAAIAEVAARDAVVANLVALAGPIRRRSGDPDGPFGALARAIVFQQLADAATNAIHGRVRAVVEALRWPDHGPVAGGSLPLSTVCTPTWGDDGRQTGERSNVIVAEADFDSVNTAGRRAKVHSPGT